MPTPSSFNRITPEQRLEIDVEIIRRNFADYDGIMAWLEKEKGITEISRSALARRGLELKSLQRVKIAMEGSRVLAEVANDDSNFLSAANIVMLQAEWNDAILLLQDLPDDAPVEKRIGLLKEASIAIKNLGKVSVDQKKWEHLIREQERKEAAEKIGAAVKKAGLSDEDWAAIRANFLGIEVAT